MPFDYKMIQIPPRISVSSSVVNGTEAAYYLETLVRAQAAHGWDFYRVDTIGVEVLPGCLASLLGAKKSYYEHYVVTFRQEVESITLMQPANEAATIPMSHEEKIDTPTSASIEPESPEEIAAEYFDKVKSGRLKSDTLYLMETPNTGSKIIERLSKDVILTVQGKQGVWLIVETNNRRGYVKEEYIELF